MLLDRLYKLFSHNAEFVYSYPLMVCEYLQKFRELLINTCILAACLLKYYTLLKKFIREVGASNGKM